MNAAQLFWQGDAVTRGVALLLLVMSVGSWVVIVWKSWLLRRASGDVLRSIAAFWSSAFIIAPWTRSFSTLSGSPSSMKFG